MNKEELTVGTDIYYEGDMANEPQFGTVYKIEDTKFGTAVYVVYNDGTTSVLSPCQFSNVYSDHNGGCRFFTKAAYVSWKKAKEAELMARYGL